MNKTSNNLWSRIGEIAGEFDLNPKTIRYYEEIGLLPEPSRNAAGYRLYTNADRERLRFIIKAKAVGMTLDEIGDVVALRCVGEEPCDHVLGLIDRKLQTLDEQLRALAEFQQELVMLREVALHGVRMDASFCWIIEQHESHHDDIAVARSST